jgi:hypothetical protein
MFSPWTKDLGFLRLRVNLRVDLGLWGAVMTAIVGPSAYGTWQDEIGFSRLRQTLDSGQPTGAGVRVALIESSLNGPGDPYLPSVDPRPTSGNFTGKVFSFLSGPAPVSGHAARAGSFFFGRNTDPLLGDASVAPGAGDGPEAGIECYQSDRWLGPDFLRLGSDAWPTGGGRVVANHSWIGMSGVEFTAEQVNEALRRLDWTVERDDAVVVVGLNNGAGTPVPPLLASAYNVLSIGRSDGRHSTGVSSFEVDGVGRIKPELVAPMTATSWSTAVVSSCAALLREAAAAFSPEAQSSEVMRALLLAGARRSPFSGWANSATRPLDAHFGAGEVNVWRSYQILAAGDGGDGGDGGDVRPLSSGPHGWRSGVAPAAGERHGYVFAVPPGCVARELAAALVWNRTVEVAPESSWLEVKPELVNLDLRLATRGGEQAGVELARSETGAQGSLSHPLEYVRQRNLAAGEYELVVDTAAAVSDDGRPYGLAWFSELVPAADPVLEIGSEPGENTVALRLTHLGVGLAYDIECSSDLKTWTVEQSVTADAVDTTVTLTLAGDPAFFRVAWHP